MRLSEVERRAIVTIAREVIGGDVQVRDIDLAERVDAFVARFGRLQDTAAEKLLPELLRQLAEPVRSAVENLDRAEKLGLIEAADRWLEARRLRNRMVHEYQSDPAQPALALNEGHALVRVLMDGAAAMGRQAHLLVNSGSGAAPQA